MTEKESPAAIPVNNRRRSHRQQLRRRAKPEDTDDDRRGRPAANNARSGSRSSRLRWCTCLASACAGGLAAMFAVLSLTSLRMLWSSDDPSSTSSSPFSKLLVRGVTSGRRWSAPPRRDGEIFPDEAAGRAGGFDGAKNEAESTQAANDLASVLDETVRLLFSSDGGDGMEDGSAAAESYTRRHGNSDFRFYVYDNLAPDYTWQRNAQCVQDALNHPSNRWGKLGLNVTSDCDWGQTACDQTRHSSSQYSKRRYNRNGDVVLSKIFTEYRGSPQRTEDPTRADLFVVPWPSAAHCECASFRKRCWKVLPSDAVRAGLLDRLGHLNATTAHRHLFFHSIVSDQAHPTVKRDLELVATIGPVDYRCGGGGGGGGGVENCGHMVVPYVNTNARYQPDRLDALLRNDEAWWTSRPRRYSLAAILSTSIAGNGRVREQFVRDTDDLFPGGAIGGLPVMIVDSGKGRRMEDERSAMDLYRDSVFCPCLRGDTPTQKRLFDALLNGCIPVVLSYNASSSSRERGGGGHHYPSHFAEGATSIRDTYPFARGSFHGEPTMGIDYGSMIVSVDGACGLPCMGATLEGVMADGERLLRLRRNIMRYVRLFAFGMGGKGLRWPDAVSAMLVQARHYVDSVEASGAPVTE